jgi:drug/metabolite transporter (DMT)-like permease
LTTPIALLAAFCFGSADFLGGIAARRVGPSAATAAINLVALLLLAAPAAVFMPSLDAGHLAAAIAGGALSAITLILIYASFSAGAMSLAAPLVACGSVGVPTLLAIATGDTPSPLQGCGIVLALAAVLANTWPSSAAATTALSRRALLLTAMAAISSGLTLAVLQLATVDGIDGALGVSGISRAAAVAICLVALSLTGARAIATRSLRLPAAAAGALEACGTTLFLLATSLGNRAVVAVLVSLYAIATVGLAQFFLRERLTALQLLGVAGAIVGVAFMSTD